MKKNIFIVAAVLFSSQLQAQDSSKTLNEVIVTANKFPQKQVETGKVLTVITQATLQKSNGKTISEVLNQQVGITINGANNNLGSNQAIYTRGANYANTLILVDGVPINDPSAINNEFDLNTFALEQVERIEILKGAQSTLYGTDAVAGVINIITKKTFNKPTSVAANFTGGSYDTYKGSISISGSDEDLLDYFVGYSKINSRGFSSAYDSTGKAGFDNDKFSRDVFQGSLGFAAGSRLKARLYAKFSNHKSDIDAGAFADDKDYRYSNTNANFGTALQYKLAKLTIYANYNYNWYDRQFKDDSLSVGGFSTYQEGAYMGRAHFAEIYTKISIQKNLDLLTGIDYRRNATDQSYRSLSFFGPYETTPLNEDSTNINQVSAYASLFFKNKYGFSTELGGRWNRHSIYGNNFTFSFNPSYLVNDKVKLFANISSAYRIPSLYQLYSEYGNKDLNPEASMSYEAGVQYTKNNAMVRLVAFKRDTKDVFVFYTDPVTYASFYKNEDKQKDMGLEAEASVTLFKKLELSANYSYVDGEIDTKDFAGKDTSYFNLYRRPKHTINFTAAYQVCSKAYISAHIRSVSDFYEPQYADKPITMKGYYTLDIYGDYKISKQFTIFADFHNITDQQYFDLRGFNARQFNWNAGINVSL